MECNDGFFNMGKRCLECPEGSSQAVQLVLVLLGGAAVMFALWKVSEADATKDSEDEEKEIMEVENTQEDYEMLHGDIIGNAKAAVASTKSLVAALPPGLSNTAIVSSIAIGNIFNISFLYTLSGIPFPEALRDFGTWLSSTFAFDLGSAGSPECAVAVDPEDLFVIKFFLTNVAFLIMCLLLTVPQATVCFRESDHRTLHSINARTAAYTLALPALTRAWVKMVDCTDGELDGAFTHKARPRPCVETLMLLCSETRELTQLLEMDSASWK
eukprot:COSAG02_NODE_997_length_15333_cov_13.688526_14_plen_271_part_00